MQQLAALEGVPFRLRVLRAHRALALYERLGFLRISADEVSFEMEWTPRVQSEITAPLRKPEQQIVCGDLSLPRHDVLDRVLAFLREIDVSIHLGPVPSGSSLPGILMIRNGLRVDPETLLYPGDLLHEAGHLAVMTPDRRSDDFPSPAGAAEEMATLAWSYAAATHLELPLEVVFHENGYKGQSHTLISQYKQNNGALGVPFLWWIGLTTQPAAGRPSIFPKMLRWLRLGDQAAGGNPSRQEVCHAS